MGADNTPVTTTVSGNTATFTMPDQNVTVTGVTFRTANTYAVTFSSNNSEYGTVSAMKGATSITSPATVTEGDEVTFTATPKDGYALSNWTVMVNGTSNTYNDSSLSLKITANTTVTANFKVEDSGTIVNNMYFCMAALTTQQVGKDSRDIINQDMESTMFMKKTENI